MFYETKADCQEALSAIRFEPAPQGTTRFVTSSWTSMNPTPRKWLTRILGNLGPRSSDEQPTNPQVDRLTDEVIQAILSTAEPGARLIPTNSVASATRSRLGGLPDLPRGAPWPTDPPISFIGQFDFAELNGEGQIVDLPTRGLLSLFFDMIRMPGDWQLKDGVDVKVHWNPTPLDLVVAEIPANLAETEGAILDSTAIKATHGIFIPDGEDRSYLELGLIDPFDLEYTEWHCNVEHDALRPDHRLGGRMSTIQNCMQEEDPETGERTMPLLQLDSNPGCSMAFGDLGRLHLWIWPDQLKANQLDRARLWWQTS